METMRTRRHRHEPRLLRHDRLLDRPAIGGKVVIDDVSRS